MPHPDPDDLDVVVLAPQDASPEVLAHLETCAECRDEVEALRAFAGVLRETRHEPALVTPPAALRGGVDRGDITPDADVDLLLDMLGATAYYRLLFGHLPVTPSLAEDVVRVVMAGVATDSWRSRHAHER